MNIRKNIYGFFNRNRDKKANRPQIRPEMGPIDWLLEGMALLGLMVLFGFVIYQFPRIPETIPSHFNGSGIPDNYSGRSSIWALPVIALFIYIMMSLFSLIPHQFNYMVKITPANALRQYTMAIRLLRYLKAAVVWLFFYISFSTVRVAFGEHSGLGNLFIPVLFGGMLLPVIIYFIVAGRKR